MGASYDFGTSAPRISDPDARPGESDAKPPRAKPAAKVLTISHAAAIVRLDAEIAELQVELDAERALRARERQRAAMDIRRLRVAHAQAEQRLINVKRMISYRLGDVLMEGFRSWGNFAAMFGKLRELSREARHRRRHRPVLEPSVLPSMAVLDAVEAGMKEYKRAGLAAVLDFIDGQAAPSEAARANIASELAKEIFEADAADGLEIGKRAIAIESKPTRLKWFAFKLFEAGRVREAKEWLDLARSAVLKFAKTSEALQASEIESHFELLTQPLTLPPRAGLELKPVPKRVAYVASSVLPFHNTGYTNRTQSIAECLRKSGYDTVVFARAGYPFDRTDVSLQPDGYAYDNEGVSYRLSMERIGHDLAINTKIALAAAAMERAFREFRPSVVQAASDHRNALPALIAARKLGLPFVYEVRGMWEFTKASKRIDWETTERFQVVTGLETLCAEAADAVLTLTANMRDELIARGINPAKIAIAPNCVDAHRFKPRPADAALRASLGYAPGDFILGYAGSLVEYEGLDDLLYATDLLRERHPNLRVLITGDGSFKPALDAIIQQHQLQNIVTLSGRVPPAEVARYVASFDAYVVARRPERVCQLVSPLKPLEGMAMQKPVIVSDVGGMAGMVEDGKTGFVHHAGDFRSLAEKIEQCLANPQRTAMIALAGRHYVETERSWERGVAEMVSAFQRFAH